MIRRRREPSPPAVPGTKTIRVVCSGRGQHSDWLFGRVTVHLDGDGGWRVTETTFGAKRVSRDSDNSPAEVTHTEDGVHATVRIRAFPTWLFECRRCGRNMPKRWDTLEQLCTEQPAIDTTKVDLSDLS